MREKYHFYKRLFSFVMKIKYLRIAITLALAFAFLSGKIPSASAQTQPSVPVVKTYEFTNGNWFDGVKFKRRVFYSANGFLTEKRPPKIDETVDLKNGFVIPPFADAHTHNLDGVRDLERMSKAYLDEGTFYVQVLGNYATGAKLARPFLNKPATLDVSYANGMLTSTYGHPFMVYEPFALGIYDYAEALRRAEEIKKSRRGENNAYWFLDTKADVDRKWEKILAAEPDIIKIGLLDAENYAKHVAAGTGDGLSPEVAEYVVQKSHKAGLRVYAHIETANDFRLGLRIGVDGFAHAPDYNWDGKTETSPRDDLTAADIKLAARKKVVVVPTAARGVFRQTDYDANGKGTLDRQRFERVVARYRKLYNQMHRSGVRLAFGLDSYGSTLTPEIWYFHDNKIFDNRTLLKIAAETTAQTIFPDRRIGRLREGYEASFLVLGDNPLKNFAEIKNIKLRFKQGRRLNYSN